MFRMKLQTVGSCAPKTVSMPNKIDTAEVRSVSRTLASFRFGWRQEVTDTLEA